MGFSKRIDTILNCGVKIGGVSDKVDHNFFTPSFVVYFLSSLLLDKAVFTEKLMMITFI